MRAAAARPAVSAARPPGRGRVIAKIGYARVSTRSQNDGSQVEDLTAYGCDKIFTDTAPGRPPADLPEPALTYETVPLQVLPRDLHATVSGRDL